ncbi:hypothetical protein OROMI_016535 [Orobanche minor]
MPDYSDTYVHRVGRSGRFGTKGLAITFVSSGSYSDVLNQVQERFEVDIKELPEQIDISTYIMARKVRNMSKGVNSSRKRNPVVEYASSPIRETDERNDDLKVSDDGDASRNEGSITRPTRLAASPGRDENLNSEDDGSGELHRIRGPNRGMDIPEDLEDRPTIFTVGGR